MTAPIKFTPEGRIPDMDDFRRLAASDPIAHHAMMYAKIGAITEAQAVLWTCLLLADLNAALLAGAEAGKAVTFATPYPATADAPTIVNARQEDS